MPLPSGLACRYCPHERRRAVEGTEYPKPDEIRKTGRSFRKMGKSGFSFRNVPGAFGDEEETGLCSSIGGEEIFQFNLLPRDIKAHLDRFVIRQDEAKRLWRLLCDHYNHVKVLKASDERGATRVQKSKVVSPTGVVKLIWSNIAELVGVPWALMPTSF